MDDLRQRLERLNPDQRQRLATRLSERRPARLLAYVTSADTNAPDAESLRQNLRESLPAHLVPSEVMPVDEFPRLPNGKLDRARLPRPQLRREPAESAAPDEIEERLLAVWREVLGFDEIHVSDDFFEIGGDSISSIRLVSRMRSEGFEISPTEFFEQPRIVELAGRFRNGKESAPVRERVRQYWKSLLQREDIGDDDKFFEIGGDASREVHLLNWIRAEFAVMLPMESFYETPTVAGIANLLSQAQSEEDWKGGLIPIRSTGSDTKLYVVHGLFGGIGWARDLIRHIDSSISLTGVQSRLQEDGSPLHTRVEETAAHHVEELLRQHPGGEVNLIGWCGGGMVAYEMAQQLKAQGKTVAALILIETVALDGLAKLPAWKRMLSWTLGWHQRLRTRFRKSSLGREEIDEVAMEVGGYNPDDRVTDLRRTNNEAYLNYRPQKYAGELHLFRTASSLAAGIYAERTLGWKPLVDGTLVVHELPGDHATMFDEAFIGELAKELNLLLVPTAT